MKVITKDFQILKGETEFDFPVGVTIIQGESGNGKTTIFYAIQDALTNPSGVADCINHDANSTSVRIINNGQDMTWIKTPSSSEYINNITEENFVKASKLDSRDIGDLGFYFDNKNKIINIHDEWCVLFPFGSSDVDMFRLFEDIFNISCSFTIIDELKKDEQEIKSSITKINTDINDLNKKSLNLSQILVKVNPKDPDELIAQIEQEQKTLEDLKQVELQYTKLKKTANQIVFPKEFSIKDLTASHASLYELIAAQKQYEKNNILNNLILPEVQTFNLVLDPIFKDVITYQNILTQVAEYEENIVKLDKELKNIQSQIDNIKVCPTCGKEL